MAEFNPFDVPVNGTGTPAAKPEPRQPAQRPPRKPLKDRLPQNAFGNFLRRFWVPVCAVVVVALVLVVFGNAILVKVAPNWALGRSTAKTANAIEQRIDASPYKALELFGQSLLSGSVGCEFTYYDDWSDAFGSVELVSDLKDLDLSLGADVTVNGQQMDGKLYLNEERVALESSYLSQCYGVSFENFEENLRQSILGQSMSEEQIRQICDALEQMQETLDFNMEELIAAYTDRYAEFLDELDFQSSSEKVSVGGDRVSCTALTAELDERMIRSLAVDCVNILFEDESVRDAMISAYMAEYQCTRESAEQEYERYVSQTVEMLDRNMREFQCDLEIIYYLYRNNLVKAEVNGELVADIGDDPLQLEYVMDFGKNPEKDDWLITYTLRAPSGLTQIMEAVYSTDSDSKSYSDSMEITISDGWDGDLSQNTMKMETEWDKRSGDLEMYFYDSYGGTQQFNCNLLVDGKSCALTLDQFASALPAGAYLELTLTADQTAKIGNPDYLDLGQWDESVLEDLENAVNAVRESTSGGQW